MCEEELLAQIDEKEEWIKVLERSVADYEMELKELYEKAHSLEWIIHELNSSAAFKVASRIARAAQLVAPMGTRRRRLLSLSYRAARLLPKLRNQQWVLQQASSLRNRIRATLSRLCESERILGSRFLGSIHFRRHFLSNPPGLPSFDRLDVSIIIPVFNHCRDTFACIDSIARFTSGPAYEVIVVNDGSTDETSEMLSRVRGLISLRNDTNLGFIGSCNRGASVARGEYLVFLNNDTVVTDGWLTALARTFQEIPGTGYAGAKLIYPDGRLQEAGSVVWRDASGWNYGKFDDPDHPRYSFAREVHYCSGACVMVPRALFEELGGFDPHFTPAYYEDTDLAFKIRHAGHKVIYQPLARIIHHEGLTSGTSPESGVTSFQRVNQVKFRERWKDRLDAHHPEPPEGVDLNQYTRSVEIESRRRVLVIDARILTPDRDCGSLRMREVMRALRRRGQHVTFIPDNMLSSSPYLEDLQHLGVEVIHHPFYRSVATYLHEHGREFGLVIISREHVAALHMTTVRRFAPQAKVVFDTVDLHFLREQREAELKQAKELQEAVAVRRKQELRLARRADLTLVVSPFEKSVIEKECPGIEVRILPTIYPLTENEIPGFEDRQGIIFIGGFEHSPNVDAVLYFAQEIFPLIRARIPDATFQIVGPDAPPEIQELASPAIQVLGFVPDVDPIFAQARVAVAPIRFGAGVKGKVNQSMALGVPTVVTSVAAEGMHLVHDRDAMIADEPSGFADAVVRLWTSRQLWERLSSNGRTNVRKHFSVEAAEERVDELLQWAGLPASNRDPQVSLAFEHEARCGGTTGRETFC
jgi:GT2 family glycosyltransferase/glycosyltransferase involved in cell wall biosynthesis